MKFNFAARVLVTALALTAVPLTAIAQEEPGEGETISFTCGRFRGSPATFVEGDPSPLIVWQTRFFGSNWTPSERCRTVTDRLNNAVSTNGLDNVLFTNGRVNNLNVICWIPNEGEECNSDNTLLTLGRRTTSGRPINPVAVLEQFEARLAGQADPGPIVSATGKKVVRLRDIIRRR